MTKLLTMAALMILLAACSAHRTIRVRCTDRLQPINTAADKLLEMPTRPGAASSGAEVPVP